MGVKITDLIEPKALEFQDLHNKTIAVDAFNVLYQFITTIRQPDGSPLTDDNGKVTSHLVGLFYRLTNLLKRDIRMVFVFDGESHSLKHEEQKRRNEAKAEAKEKYEKAVEEEDIEGMKKYASRTSRLTSEMIEESKNLLSAMGIPWIQAPGEGEAQCARIVSNGDAFAVMSQDADALLFGSPRIVKNLSISQRRKQGGRLSYDKVRPELIVRDEILERLHLTQEKLIILGILVGTDFNPGGIKGIGPKKALKIVQEKEGDWEDMFSELGWYDLFEHSWKEVYDIFKESDVKDDYDIAFKEFEPDKVMKILVDDHGFSRERISSVCDELVKTTDNSQKGLGDFM